MSSNLDKLRWRFKPKPLELLTPDGAPPKELDPDEVFAETRARAMVDKPFTMPEAVRRAQERSWRSR